MAPESVWTSLIGWLFLIANSGRLLAYLPQIVAVVRCDVGAKSVSILTWGYFAFAHLTALLYALVVLHDEKSVWIFSGNFVVTVVLVAIVYLKRRRYGSDGYRREPRLASSVAIEDMESPSAANWSAFLVKQAAACLPTASRRSSGRR
jgi:uncharacterized membrane protein YwaF